MLSAKTDALKIFGLFFRKTPKSFFRSSIYTSKEQVLLKQTSKAYVYTYFICIHEIESLYLTLRNSTVMQVYSTFQKGLGNKMNVQKWHLLQRSLLCCSQHSTSTVNAFKFPDLSKKESISELTGLDVPIASVHSHCQKSKECHWMCTIKAQGTMLGLPSLGHHHLGQGDH